MEPLLIARITNRRDDNFRLVWTFTLSHSELGDSFLTYHTGNENEVMAAPESFGNFFGYREDEIEIRHLY